MALKTKADPILKKYQIKQDPNQCFVLFSSTFLTAATVSISLQGLLSQVTKFPADRKVKTIEYLPVGQKLVILFEDQADSPITEGV